MMEENLKKIEIWLGANAPKIMDSLLEPATLTQLMEFEKLIGKTLPEDFKQLYLWHNGTKDEKSMNTSFFYGFFFKTIEQIIDEFKDRMETTREMPKEAEDYKLEFVDIGIDMKNVCNPYWLFFAHDYNGIGLFIDLSPTDEGQYGQIIYVDYEYNAARLVAASTASLVADFIHDLENDLYSLTEEDFLEVDESIDILNWPPSEKWSRSDLKKG